MNKLKASEEFEIGKHGIGYISSSFASRFADSEFEKVSGTPTFQKLPRYMNDAEIETELKPGICTLGDILAFMDNAPEGTKDGWFNLFYTPTFVVCVRWDVGAWGVDAWARGRGAWGDYDRVFSPAIVHSESKDLSLESSDTLSLESRVAALEAWRDRVQQL